MFEQPARPRHTVIERGGGVDFIVPARRNFFVLAFLSFWLVLWGCGELFAARMLLKGPISFVSLFLLAWLGGWTVGGYAAIYTWFWTLAGREIISVSFDALALQKEIFGLGRKRMYDPAEMKRLRVVPVVNEVYRRGSNSYATGRLAFDYGAKTVRFAEGVDEAEAAQILERMNQVLPPAGR